ncbi:MAG TPA: M42 family metallopeptidase [Clostridiaceae bacterium]|nr:M42 family metallopeptidase [Clostridiaceae bacterium]
MLLKNLTQINGVSGNEEKVREFIKKEIENVADEIKVDKVGNLIAYKKGTASKFKLLLSAHMDEVGFIVTGHSEDGLIKFRPVGGIDQRVLPGKRVVVGDKGLKGVIGCKPIHLQEKDERDKNIKIKSMYIDIGCDKRDEAEKLAGLGEYIAFDSKFTELGSDCIKAKALDDRVGCAIIMELLKQRYEFDLYASFTVQEEIGLRGSEVVGYQINPDIAIVIEGTTCSDVPGIKEHEYSTELGKGPVITVMDRTAYADKDVVNFIYDTARKYKIDVQFKKTTTGGNDAGKIQRSRCGVKVASISVPCRYIHSPSSVMSRKDYEGCIKLMEAVLKELENNTDYTLKILNGGNCNV